MSSWFRFKDKISKALRSKVVYQFQCGKCNTAYAGKTMRHMSVRAAEHLGRSPLTGKPTAHHVSSIRDHLMFTCGSHVASLDVFKKIASASSNFELELKESLLIHRDKPVLNKNVTSIPLDLFSTSYWTIGSFPIIPLVLRYSDCVIVLLRTKATSLCNL